MVDGTWKNVTKEKMGVHISKDCYTKACTILLIVMPQIQQLFPSKLGSWSFVGTYRKTTVLVLMLGNSLRCNKSPSYYHSVQSSRSPHAQKVDSKGI